ncbi:hypothetical protein ACIBI3_23830 [Actinomadura luteofluorescens]|uniref:protein kinase domain-containing protein n=1 Tax=Actinomadura luteofluorescens TaxID=46163 RepID=UPI003494C819
MESGLRLTERYRLVERLDDGGTMEVWRAWDELLGRPVAVKVLAPAGTGPQRGFRRGVNRAAALSHAALETVFDSDQTRDASGRLASFVVTEFLVGETLTERLRRGPLAAPEAAAVCGQIAGALEAAHAAGVTHGDLKPDRVVLVHGDAGHDVKVVDTGIGGVVRASADGGTETADTKAADVRALGVIIAACLAPGASEELSALAARCTGPDAPSAAEVAALLSRDEGPPNAVFTTPGTAPPNDHRTSALPPPPPPPAPPAPPAPARRGNARLAPLALVVAIPVTAAAAVLLSAPRSPVAVPAPAQTSAAPPAPAPTLRTPPAATAPRVTDALGRLRPIVSRGYAAGEIRSDVAIDLDNVITNLENDLTADRNVDVGGRIAELHDKIVTRRRERGLSPGLADELDRVLATVQS